MCRHSGPVDWGKVTPEDCKLTDRKNKKKIQSNPEGVDKILESVADMTKVLYADSYPPPPDNDVIPMSELEPIDAKPISSSEAEFLGLDCLGRQELDSNDSTPPPPAPAPFAATLSEDAAVREDPFSTKAV